MLPSRFVDEAAARLFVKYRIRQKADNPAGAVIDHQVNYAIDESAPTLAPSIFHTIEKPTNYRREDIDLCENTPFGGVYYIDDALAYDTLRADDSELITLSYLNVKSNSYGEIDTTLTRGDRYDDRSWYRDTTITRLLTASNGCDSILTVHILIDVTGTSELTTIHQLRLSPNPTTDHTMLSFGLQKNTTLHIALLNSLGQTVQIIQQQQYTPGHHQLRLHYPKLPPGTYHVLIRSQEGQIVRRLIKL